MDRPFASLHYARNMRLVAHCEQSGRPDGVQIMPIAASPTSAACSPSDTASSMCAMPSGRAP